MAAISVTPGVSYSIRIEERGWIPRVAETRHALAGGIQVLRVVMRMPPIH
jgi:hypothetical protein